LQQTKQMRLREAGKGQGEPKKPSHEKTRELKELGGGQKRELGLCRDGWVKGNVKLGKIWPIRNLEGGIKYGKERAGKN